MSTTAQPTQQSLQSLLQRFQQSTSQRQKSTSRLHRAHGENDTDLWERCDAASLVERYPELSSTPANDERLILTGEFRFHSDSDGVELEDSFDIRIEVSAGYPQTLPMVFETGSRVPRAYHHMDDRSLCLGSPLKLRLALGREYSLTDFMHKCVVPYFHGWLVHDQSGSLPFGELAHGDAGLMDDYMRIFQVNSRATALKMLFLAGRPRAKANRQPCPCNSGQRVGKCHHLVLNALRKRVGRLWFRDEYRWRSKAN